MRYSTSFALYRSLNLEKYRATLLDVVVFIRTEALVLFIDTLNGRGDPKTLFHNKMKENEKWKGTY
jgi:hypothetical protein